MSVPRVRRHDFSPDSSGAKMSLVSEIKLLESPDETNRRALVTEHDATGLRAQRRARDRADIERRRAVVVRLRFLEHQMTAVDIVSELARLDPPIVVTARTIERDIAAIKADARRYLRVDTFDARAVVDVALLRFDLLARRATALAMERDDPTGAVWGRVALLASEAKMGLLQKMGLIDPSAFRLPPDEGKRGERVPNGDEIRAWLRSVKVPADSLVSEAERAWSYGDAAAAQAAGNEARTELQKGQVRGRE